MAIKKFKPVTPGSRFRSIVDQADVLTKKKPEKALLEPLAKSGGRNHHGRITSRRRGGGHKRRYRRIDFRRNKFGVPGKVHAIEYDPNRSSNIALIHYADGEKRYILHPRGLQVGATITAGPDSDIRLGNALPLGKIPLGTVVHNIELKPGKGGQMARSAGAGVQIVAKEDKYVSLRLPSTEVRQALKECLATIGQVGNIEHNLQNLGKAGANRWRGRRPKVRGVAMNPVDHPHGGGEGRSSGGRHPVTPWGVSTKGKRTRNNKRTDKLILRRRRHKK